MENQEYFDEAEYIRGFNQGYIVSKEYPEFADILKGATGKSDLLDGMKDGREQYLEEQLNKDKDVQHPNLPEFLKRDRLEDNSKNSRDIEKDIEPER